VQVFFSLKLANLVLGMEVTLDEFQPGLPVDKACNFLGKEMGLYPKAIHVKPYRTFSFQF